METKKSMMQSSCDSLIDRAKADGGLPQGEQTQKRFMVLGKLRREERGGEFKVGVELVRAEEGRGDDTRLEAEWKVVGSHWRWAAEGGQWEVSNLVPIPKQRVDFPSLEGGRDRLIWRETRDLLAALTPSLSPRRLGHTSFVASSLWCGWEPAAIFATRPNSNSNRGIWSRLLRSVLARYSGEVRPL